MADNPTGNTMTKDPNKTALGAYAGAFARNDLTAWADAAEAFFAADAAINVVHPFNAVAGASGYISQVLAPLAGALDQLRRVDFIAMGGSFENADWVGATGTYSGNFVAPWLGIQPTGTLTYLRFAEFHRMVDGRARESYVFLDIPALMIAAGQWPIKEPVALHRGYTGAIPGPATHDGLQWHQNDPARSAANLAFTEEMLLNLATEDELWRPYWHEDMSWYGPAAFGAFQGIEEFANFQTPFEGAFSEWISGLMPGSRTRHFCRAADGDYVCLGGWPSLNCVQTGRFLDQAPTGKRLYMRVCDFWRMDGDKLAENWVLVDIPHVLDQLGVRLFD